MTDSDNKPAAKSPEIISSRVTDQPLPSPCVADFARYTEFEDMAVGGGSTLRTAFDPHLGRRVIIKQLLPEFRDDAIMQLRFLREARVTAMIQHPATVPVHEVARSSDGLPYFTMKKIEGHTFKKILEGVAGHLPEFKQYTPRDVLVDVVVQVGQALAYAHQCGVVHRDIKPANIIVGDFNEVMVMDWGIAKLIAADEVSLPPGEDPEEPAMSLGLTEKGKVYGTPRYMSPEQARGEVDIDERSDIFSLGIMLYEAITLRPFVIGMERKELMRRIRDDVVIPPRKKEPMKMIPHDLDAVCMKALHKDVDQRYQSMREFVIDLQRYRRDEPVSVSDESGWERTKRFLQNKNIGKNSILLMILVGLLAYWLGTRS